MKAQSIIRDKQVVGTVIIERKVWQVPVSKDHPAGYKYALHCCSKDGHCFVRYDNERGKGEHVHYGSDEVGYKWQGLATLLLDFDHDVWQLTGIKR